MAIFKPVVLTVAVGPSGLEDAAFIAAFARALASDNAAIRLSLSATSGPTESLDRLAKRSTQLAVVRSDGAASERLRAIAILHTDPVVIVAPEKSKVENFGQLKDKVIGVIGPPGANDARRFLGLRVDSDELPLPQRLGDIIQSVKEANSIQELDITRARVDAAVERVAAGATSGSLDAEKTGMVALAVHYLDDIIAERRNQLKGEAQRSRDSTHTRTVSQ